MWLGTKKVSLKRGVHLWEVTNVGFMCSLRASSFVGLRGSRGVGDGEGERACDRVP